MFHAATGIKLNVRRSLGNSQRRRVAAEQDFGHERPVNSIHQGFAAADVDRRSSTGHPNSAWEGGDPAEKCVDHWRRADLLLFLGTPLLLIALFQIAERFWSLAALSVFTTVLAMGHYLPGLMRAYGDPALFRRFRWRFILAPIFFITAAIVMIQRDSQAFLMVVVVWGAWHWLMQTYGLVRIYDSKARNFDSLSARLDYTLCLAWFGVLYWQTDGASGVLMHYYRAGGRFPPEWVPLVAKVWGAATLAITLLYVVHLVKRTRAGNPPSPLKLLLLVVSFVYYLYAFGYASSKLIAFGLFEGYHDIQYLAIVWVFNRNRAAKDSSAGTFTRFLFRQRMPLILLYVVLCLAFGSYDFVARSMDEGQIAQVALSVITGLALIHFYFDGFIWRIREPETRATLEVEGDAPASRVARLTPSLRHGLLWVALVVPLGLLVVTESGGRAVDELTACQEVLRARPDSHKAHYLLGSELLAEGQVERARPHIERARELRPGYDLYEVLHADLVLAREQLSDAELDEVIRSYERAEKTRPEVAKMHRNWATALRRRGDLRAAAGRYQVALLLDPTDANAFYEYAVVLARQRNFQAAGQACAHAVELNPDHVEARSLLGSILMALGQHEQALTHYREALRVEPRHARVLVQLALALATVPSESLRDPVEASRLADTVRDVTGDQDPGLLNDLATVYFATGHSDTALAVLRRAVMLYQQAGQVDAANQLLQRIARAAVRS